MFGDMTGQNGHVDNASDRLHEAITGHTRRAKAAVQEDAIRGRDWGLDSTLHQ